MNATPLTADPIGLAESRLAYLDQRQQVLARNVANADTPGFQASDLPDFATVLQRQGAADWAGMLRTDAKHLAGTTSGDPRAKVDRTAAERSPDGNTVALDQQAMKIAENDTAHALATTVRTKYLSLFQAALGRGS